MTTFEAIILGLVQGLTEFLPISSTAHLWIIPHLLGWSDPGAAFSAVIQLGTLGAVIVYFYQDLLRLTKGVLQGLIEKQPLSNPDAQMGWSIALGSIPIIVLGLSFKDWIEEDFRQLEVIATSLIVMGVLMYVAEKYSSEQKNMATLTWKQILWIGCCQAMALIPGSSRSGSTIMGGLLVGLKKEDAARFSFLLGFPAILGSGLFELKTLFEEQSTVGVMELSIGIFVAFVSGYLSIDWLIKILTRFGTLPFMLYRVALGAGLWLWI